MNCFNHPETSAIGTCKACHKGLCSACVTDLGHGLACENSHEQEVKDLQMITSRSTQIYNDAPKNMYIMPLFFLFMGLVYSGYCLYRGNSITSMPVVLGFGFIVFSLVLFVANKRIYSKDA